MLECCGRKWLEVLWCLQSSLVITSTPGVVSPGTKIVNKILNITNPLSKVAFKPATKTELAKRKINPESKGIAVLPISNL